MACWFGVGTGRLLICVVHTGFVVFAIIAYVLFYLLLFVIYFGSFIVIVFAVNVVEQKAQVRSFARS